MVKARININQNTNRVLNIIKVKYGLKNKSKALSLVVKYYEENLLEPELRPEYKVKLTKIIRGKHLSRAEFEKAVRQMSYNDHYSKDLVKKLSKLKKRDPAHYNIVCKKMDQILANPEHKHKDLHYDMKGIQRVHLGHFVLVFIIDPFKKTISFEDYDHHDNIYKN